MNEWLKVMLGEIERKKAERTVALEEQRSRAADQPSATDSNSAKPVNAGKPGA